MPTDNFAFLVPVVMTVFGGAFLLAARWGGASAIFWAVGLFSSAAGFSLPMTPMPVPAVAFAAEACFLLAMLAYGEALLRRFGVPTMPALRTGFAALAYAGIVLSIIAGDLRTELLLSDLASAALLAWPVGLVLRRARHALDWALLAVIGVIIAETMVRVLALSWLVTAGSGPEAFFQSDYALAMQASAGIIVSAFALTALAGIVHAALEDLRRDAERDPLTGLLNRRGLDRVAAALHRDDGDFSVVEGDLDNFKGINDTHGHGVGDLVLQRTAELFAALAPKGAIVSRFGGEEFVLLLPGLKLAEAGLVAHRLRLALAGQDWRALGLDRQLTGSFGAAQWTRGDHALGDALARADAALYLAKAAGRNQVFLESRRRFEPPAPQVLRSA